MAKQDPTATGVTVRDELLRIFPADYSVGYGELTSRWQNILHDLQVPFKFANLRGVYLHNIEVTSRSPLPVPAHGEYTDYFFAAVFVNSCIDNFFFTIPGQLILPSLEEYELHLKCRSLATSLESLSAVDVQNIIPDVRQFLFFRNPYSVRVKLTFNSVVMLGLSHGQVWKFRAKHFFNFCYSFI